MSNRKLVQGVGVNDADYAVHPTINGKKWKRCPFYDRWSNMLKRCYSKSSQDARPTYKGCSVDPVWYSFMSFKTWMERQEWENGCLDKDILIEGNKVYGPDTCVFVSNTTNMFLIDCGNARGELPLGVTFNSSRKNTPYKAQVSSGKGISKHLGYFATAEEAHQAWYKRKRELAIELAAQQTDPRVAKALITRFI